PEPRSRPAWRWVPDPRQPYERTQKVRPAWCPPSLPVLEALIAAATSRPNETPPSDTDGGVFVSGAVSYQLERSRSTLCHNCADITSSGHPGLFCPHPRDRHHHSNCR